MLLKTQRRFEFNDFQVDLGLRTVLRKGRTISLSPKTFDLLVYFVRNPQRLVTKEELMTALWHDAHVEESNLSQHVFLLRKALTASQPGDKLIATVPGRGYQLTADVVAVDEPEAESAPPISTVAPAHGRLLFQSDESTPRVSTVDREESETSETASTDRRRLAVFLRPGPQLYTLIGCVLLLTVAGCWLGLRSLHRAHPESLRIVIDDFENTTGDPDFDPALRTAFSIDLHQSPYIDIASQAQVQARLAEMKVAPGTRISPEIARGVCRRLNSQAYLTGAIHRFAEKYLITIQAFDCSSGSTLATSKGIANSPDGLVMVLDKVAADIRKQLGESSQSVTRFSKPLFAVRSGSLEAVKVYSDAIHLAMADKLEDSIPLFQRAIQIDPQFTMAYADLGSVYNNLGEKDLATSSLSKAYELRNTADEPDRLFITATFNDLVTKDIQASIRNDKEWAEEYPRNPAPLSNLADLQTQIGKPALAIDAAKQAVALNPNDGLSYVVLARAQMHLGHFEEAASTCNEAIKRHIDGEQIHGFLMQIAFLRLDQDAMDAQMDWASDTPSEPYMQLQQGLMDFALGKVHAAQSVFAKMIDGYRKQGMTEKADLIASGLPRIEAELGYTETASAALTRLTEIQGSTDIPIAWAEVGETSRADTILKRESDARPTDTLWQEYQAPQIKAAIALTHDDPETAITALEPALPYDLRSFDAPSLRARAYFAGEQPLRAESEFHKILDHPGLEPLSYNYPLAQLGLARSLAKEGKTVEAGFAYKVVLSIWKDADSDMPRLKEAKAEYAKLTGQSAKLALSGEKPSKPDAAKPRAATPRPRHK